MLVKITGRNVELSSAIRDHVTDRLHAALDQHAHHVRRVDVRLGDVNGPRGGRDSVCHILIVLVKGPILKVRRIGEDLYANVSLAADKAGSRVRRVVGQRFKNAHRAPA